MRIAFLIQAHANPAQISQLTRSLQALGGDVFLHYDRKSAEPLDGLPDGVRCVERIPVYHGGFSQVACTLLMLEQAVAQGYDRYFLLSGQCFPIKSRAWLLERLALDVDYLNIYPMPCDRLQKRLDRLQHHHFERHAESVGHKLMNRLARLLPKRDFVNGLSVWPHAGSNWWCLRHDSVAYVLDYVRRMPGFVRFMSTTSYADEVFFQSILSNMGPGYATRPALFHAEFEPASGRPRLFTMADVPMLDATEAFVARKFDLAREPQVLLHYAAAAAGGVA